MFLRMMIIDAGFCMLFEDWNATASKTKAHRVNGGDDVADWQTAARYPYKALRYRTGKAAWTGDVRKKWEGPLYPRPNRAAREELRRVLSAWRRRKMNGEWG
jgi:hypothetical protein